MTNALECAVSLLARREHGALELVEKIMLKGFNRQDAEQALANCQRLGLQSDVRYAEQLCRARINQGYGPLRITQELQAKRIDADLIDNLLAAEQANWYAYARQAWLKKFKAEPAQSFDALQKQRRFLLYRGFTSDVAARVLKCVE